MFNDPKKSYRVGRHGVEAPCFPIAAALRPCAVILTIQCTHRVSNRDQCSGPSFLALLIELVHPGARAAVAVDDAAERSGDDGAAGGDEDEQQDEGDAARAPSQRPLAVGVVVAGEGLPRDAPAVLVQLDREVVRTVCACVRLEAALWTKQVAP